MARLPWTAGFVGVALSIACGTAVTPIPAPRQPANSSSTTQALKCARTLPPTTKLPLDIVATAVATGDLDGDGCPDLVLDDGAGNLRLVFDRAGGLAVERLSTPADLTPHVADVNGDGHPDLIFQRSGEPYLDILLNDGSGHFEVATSYEEPSPGAPSEIAVGDFDGDGFADVASSCDPIDAGYGDMAPAQCIRFGAQEGFGAPVVFNFGSTFRELHAADMAGAGRPQIITHWIAPHAGEGFIGIGVAPDRTVTQLTSFETDYHCGNCQDATFADIDGDGRADFAWRSKMEPAAFGSPSTGWADEVIGLERGADIQPNGTYSALPFGPSGWTVGRFDEGTMGTLAAIGAQASPGSARPVIFRAGRTDSTFAPDRESSIDLEDADPLFANALDLDGNGHDDLVVTTASGIFVVMNP